MVSMVYKWLSYNIIHLEGDYIVFNDGTRTGVASLHFLLSSASMLTVWVAFAQTKSVDTKKQTVALNIFGGSIYKMNLITRITYILSHGVVVAVDTHVNYAVAIETRGSKPNINCLRSIINEIK